MVAAVVLLRGGASDLAVRLFHVVSLVAPCGLGGQVVTAGGGPQPCAKSWVPAVSQGRAAVCPNA
jgi:hypothetical protein